MNELMMRLWSDDAGYILSAESVFLFTITVLGITVGMVAVRGAVVSELTEVANAISSLDQSYSFYGLANCNASVNGSGAIDTPGYTSFVTIVPFSQPISVNPCTGTP